MNDPFRQPPPWPKPRNPFLDLYDVLFNSHEDECRPLATSSYEIHARARMDFIAICKSTDFAALIEKLYGESAFNRKPEDP